MAAFAFFLAGAAGAEADSVVALQHNYELLPSGEIGREGAALTMGKADEHIQNNAMEWK